MFSSNFDGTSRGQKNVRMGGKKRDQGKAQVLARARLERAAREEERQRQRSAETVQRWWRGRRCACAWRRGLQESWDAQLDQLLQVLHTFRASGVAFHPPVETLAIFLRQLVAFHRFHDEPRSSHRVHRMCSLLLQSAQACCKEQSWTLHGLDLVQEASEEFGRWAFVTGRFLGLVFGHVQRCMAPVQTAAAAAAAGDEVLSPDRVGPFLGDLLSTCSVLLASREDSELQRKLSGVLRAFATRCNAPGLFSTLRVAWEVLDTPVAADVPNLAAAQTVLEWIFPVVEGTLIGVLTDSPSQTVRQSTATLESFAAEVLSYPSTSPQAAGFLKTLSASVTSSGWWRLVRACHHAVVGPIDLYPAPSNLTPSAAAVHPSGPKRPRSASTEALLSPSWPKTIRRQLSDDLPCLLVNLLELRPSTVRVDASAPPVASVPSAPPAAEYTSAPKTTDASLLVHLVQEARGPLCSWLASQGLPTRAASGAHTELSGRASEEQEDEDDMDLGLEEGFSAAAAAAAGAAAAGDAETVAQGFRGLDALIARRLRLLVRGSPQRVVPGTGNAPGNSCGSGGGGATESRPTSASNSMFQLLARSSTVGFLFNAVLAPSCAPATPSSNPTLLLADMYGDCLAHTRYRDPQYQRIVQVLARGSVDQFLPRMWAALRPGLVGQRSCPSWLELPVLLFGAVYSFSLLALDDTEVFDRGLPLGQSEQFEVTVTIRGILYDLFWDRATSEGGEVEPSLPRLQLQACLGRLYNQLYDRHARRDFKHIPRDQWLWPEPPTLEISDASRPHTAPDADGMVARAQRSRRIGMIFTCIPQVIPFQARILRFQQLIEEDQQGLGGGGVGFDGVFGPVIDLKVRRDSVYEDAMEALDPLGRNLKSRIRVAFESDLGHQEAGIDGGGLFRDFMDVLCERAFDPQHGMFNVTQDQLLYPNPAAPMVHPDSERHFAFMGRVLGKAVYSQILVKPQFTLFFLNKLLNRANQIDDLYTLDPEMYRNLISLKDIARSGGNLEDLTLTFSVSSNMYGRAQNRDLVPGGSEVVVDNSNFFEYQYRLADFHLNKEIAPQCRAFLRGFHDIIPVDWIRMFDARELQMVIGGTQRNIDVANLRTYTQYAGGFHESQPFIQAFWRVLKSFTPAQQGDFLKFVTSCSRQPILGFAYLQPPICIQKVPLDSGSGFRLPMAATCMNLLKLPEYPDEETLRSKLLYAISANAGFELS